MILVDYARNEVGLPMCGLYRGYHVGWTTDAEKARLMREAGASVTYVSQEREDACGWEVAFMVGREKVSPSG